MKHPSKDIIGTKGNELDGKRIVLCITGSVAATRCVEIARELMRHGAEVFTVMSSAAQKIIHPYLMEWATGNPVVTELTGKVEHVALAGERANKADLILIAPATANTISKIACGIDDTPVTSVASTALGANIPILIAPAMHGSMYRHPVLKENMERLQRIGIEFIGPRIEEGTAKIAETNEIIERVIHRLTVERDLEGMKFLVTAGPTVEHIDPIRVITNKSSGKMGIAIVKEAIRRGAELTLVYGLGTEKPPLGANVISVETTNQMYEAVVSELRSKNYDVVIATAAVADWSLEKPYTEKISTHETESLSLKLKPTRKIIKEIKKVNPRIFLVAFRAEYNKSDEKLIDNAYERLKEMNADLIVVNDVARKGVGFRVDTNEVFIIDKNKHVIHVPLSPKDKVARKIIDVIIKKMKTKRD